MAKPKRAKVDISQGSDAADAADVADEFLTAGVELAPRWAKIAILDHFQGQSHLVAVEAVSLAGAPDTRAVLASLRRGWGDVLGTAALTPSDIVMVGWTGTPVRGLEYVRPFHALQTAEAACRARLELATDVVFAAAYGAALLAASRFLRVSSRTGEPSAKELPRRVSSLFPGLLN